MESENDWLWGTGVLLAREGCLNKERWITPGILGELLMEVRENQTMFPSTKPVKSYSTTHIATTMSIGVTSMPLLGVTPNDIPTTSDMRSPTNPSSIAKPVQRKVLPGNSIDLVEITTPQAADTGTMQLSMDHPSMVPEPINADQETSCSASTVKETSAMETS